jgi:hypothetical protein
MDRQSYLNLMQFPPEWQDWNMLPFDLVDAQRAGYEAGHEHGSEHDRHSVFQWWLKQGAGTELLILLAHLTWLDPDQVMAGYVRDCIAKQPQFNSTVAAAIATSYHRA